jgi:aminoglycoside N3'-acetyltransferase
MGFLENNVKVWVIKLSSPVVLKTLRSLRSRFRAVRRTLQPTLTKEVLLRDLSAAGIGKGDVVMIHSAMSQIGKLENGASTVLESLIEALTPEGTLVMPCYLDLPAEEVLKNFSKGEWVDLRTARSANGKITDCFRSLPGVHRSSHPFSSVCAWGRHAKYITSDHATDPRICHAKSPIGRVLELRGKIVGLGVSLGPVSFYHVVEDTWEGFPFNPYLPASSISYIDGEGNRVTREICRYDPEISRTRIDSVDGVWIREYVTDALLRKKVLKSFKFGRAASWVAEAVPFYEVIKDLAREGITIYTTAEDYAQMKKVTPTGRDI